MSSRRHQNRDFFKIHIRQIPIVMKRGGYVEYDPIITNLKCRRDDVIIFKINIL